MYSLSRINLISPTLLHSLMSIKEKTRRITRLGYQPLSHCRAGPRENVPTILFVFIINIFSIRITELYLIALKSVGLHTSQLLW
jgi:hypothetical protein